MRLSATGLLALACAGCSGTTTRSMAESCQRLLDKGDRTDIRTFLEDAQARLDRLAAPKGRVGAYLQELQDPDAAAYRAPLEQCVWELRNL